MTEKTNLFCLSSFLLAKENAPNIDYEFLFKIRGYTRESLKIFIKKPVLRDSLDKIVLEGSY